MTDPKNSEAQNEELNLEQLEDAAGGLGACELKPSHKQNRDVMSSSGSPGPYLPGPSYAQDKAGNRAEQVR